MLRFKRKVGQVVVITTADGDEVRVTFDGLDGRAAKLTFDAPPRVRVDRLEIHKLRKKDGE